MGNNRKTSIPNYYEQRVNSLKKGRNKAWLSTLERHNHWYEQGRYVRWDDRKNIPQVGLDSRRNSEIPADTLLMSQGRRKTLQWQGKSLYKSVFDFAIVPMLLSELRPAVIIEVGSGNGSSAIWMAQLMELHGTDCEIVSIDIEPVKEVYPNVTFIQRDACAIGEIVDNLSIRHGPKLVIEDAHVCVDKILDFAIYWLKKGDYILVEDSTAKTESISRFLNNEDAHFLVDTLYTDFFGRNATSCVDSIFVKTK